MNYIESNVYQAIQEINREKPADIADIQDLTHLTYEQIDIALKSLYQAQKISIPSDTPMLTSRDEDGNTPIGFDQIIAN